MVAPLLGSCLSSFLGAKEGGWVGKRQWREEGDRETKPERETMTLEVTHSYHELPQSEGKNNEGLSLPSTARGQPYGHSTFSNPIFCVLRVIICKALVPSENTESKQWLGLVFICTLKRQCVGKLTLKKKEIGNSKTIPWVCWQ